MRSINTKWWGCSIAGAKTAERDEEEGRPVFTLHYDAYQAFEEADHDVCFVDRSVVCAGTLYYSTAVRRTWYIELFTQTTAVG